MVDVLHIFTRSALQDNTDWCYFHQIPPELIAEMFFQKKQIIAGQRKQERASKCFPWVDKAGETIPFSQRTGNFKLFFNKEQLFVYHEH